LPETGDSQDLWSRGVRPTVARAFLGASGAPSVRDDHSSRLEEHAGNANKIVRRRAAVATSHPVGGGGGTSEHRSHLGSLDRAYVLVLVLSTICLTGSCPMPVLQILDGSGQMNVDAPLQVFGKMLFPDKQHRQIQLLINAVADYCVRNDIHCAPTALKLIQENPANEVLKKEVEERFEVGMAVGLIYCTILSLGRFTELKDRASFNTVSAIVANNLTNKGVASKRTLQSWWDTMKPVRHLWGAWVARGAQLNNFEYVEGDVGSHTAGVDFACFLVQAMQALDAGAHRSSAASKGGPLAAESFSYVMPAHWRRPKCPGPFGTFVLKEPAPEVLKQIGALKAAESSQPSKPRRK